jgi:predicted N-acetyltransferase YhbS
MTELSLAFAMQTPADLPAIQKLEERAFGPGRFARTAYRLREDAPPDLSLSTIARIGGMLVGACTLTRIAVGGAPALLLGPLTVEEPFRARGVGEALAQKSLDAAKAAGHGLVLLVGDPPFYERLGFARANWGEFVFPGPVDPGRILVHELRPGAREKCRGVVASG